MDLKTVGILPHHVITQKTMTYALLPVWHTVFIHNIISLIFVVNLEFSIWNKNC